jgi:hypothetical protein
MRDEVRLVQCCRMDYGGNVPYAPSHEFRVGDRSDAGSEGRSLSIDADGLVTRILQGSNETLAEMTAATCYQDSHALADRSLCLVMAERSARTRGQALVGPGSGC